VRRAFNTNNKHLFKMFLNKKLLINLIVLFFVIELMFIPFTVGSNFLPTGSDGDMKSAGSENDPPAVGDESTGSDSGVVIMDDSSTSSDSGSTAVGDLPSDTDSGLSDVDGTSTDSNDNTKVGEDTTTDSNDNTALVDDKTTTSDTDSNVVDDKTTDSSESNLILDKTLLDDTSNYAPNERIVSTDEIVTKSENTVGYLSSGIEMEVKIESSNDIDSVKLTPATDLEEVKVTVIKLKDKPEEIIDPPKKNVSIYKYLDIKLSSNDTFIDEEEISSLEFNFKVEKTWIADNEIDKSTVKLIRYHDGVWQNLSTTLTDENETCISYTAASPGFSTFAVVGSKVIEKGESYGSDDVGIPWSIIIAFIMILTVMLVFILFKARYIYLKDENK
jgi:PGF-pre-PGF domain-containing protein